MVHKPSRPKTESEFQQTTDFLYKVTQEETNEGNFEGFKGLVELASAEPTIITAIHKMKNNTGANTPGVDGVTMRDFLEMRYDEVISYVKDAFKKYKPLPVRRVLIDKPGKKEKRPLGIPTVGDRIVQQCIKMVIEPILEAQFYKHSYGFRPYREQGMAISRINFLIQQKGYHWVVEGDISKFFDEVNHNILIKKLWGLGIRDKRLLMIIKAMLKAGIMNECERNELGTPQGGIISPLLANAYLHCFDQWIAREWEDKVYYNMKTGKKLAIAATNTRKKKSNLRRAFLVRYADDWVIITNSKENAERWKHKAENFLRRNLNLRLSKEKTVITNASKKPIKFLGFEYKVKPSDRNPSGYVTSIRPDREKLKSKMVKIQKDARKIRKQSDINFAAHQINTVNMAIRGIVEYYQIATEVNVQLQKYHARIQKTAFKAVQKWNGFSIAANRVNNLTSVHGNYTTSVPAIKIRDTIIGVTSPSFSKRKDPTLKNPKETPFSTKGRKLYETRTGKRPLLVRADEILNLHHSEIIAKGTKQAKYNFEFYMNRAYAFNRDQGKCKICEKELNKFNVQIHHLSPKLPIHEVNRVKHLATLCTGCHKIVHNSLDLPKTVANYKVLSKKSWKKVLEYRQRLEFTNPNQRVKQDI